ncbi:serine hydrolase domain-containing protein [Streptomyces sp. NPDC057638]|uniref:serine hydrolase domain-containing protein n=1 Tax=Streptomyces sp. NPDC057638 TaxID=3346190 RepID=UPI0036BAAC52
MASLAMPLSASAAVQPSTPAGTQPGIQPAGHGRALLQQGLDDIVTDGVVGAQGTLVHGASRFHARSGTAELGTGRPVPHQGHFRMGSNTKTFVATVVLQLVGEGRMRLDDTVDHWLPGVVAGNGHDGRRITVRQLLQHTSGLPDYDDKLPGLADPEGFRKHRFDHYRPGDLIALALRDRPHFEPGKGWGYSSTGYILAGMIIEKATGNHWSEEVRSRITEPLGLKHTYSPGRLTGLPRPHTRAYQQFTSQGVLIDSTEMSVTYGGAAGDMITPRTISRASGRPCSAAGSSSPSSSPRCRRRCPPTPGAGR